MKEIDLTQPMGAIFSEDGRYRYALWRVWRREILRILLYVGLNPSTANSSENDPTIMRLMARAAGEHYDGLLAANLYGLVTSYPKVLLEDFDKAVGPKNDAHLRGLISIATLLKGSRVLCGWGSFPAARKRASAVLDMIPEPYCLGVTKGGQPKHPLYIGYDVPMIEYRGVK